MLAALLTALGLAVVLSGVITIMVLMIKSAHKDANDGYKLLSEEKQKNFNLQQTLALTKQSNEEYARANANIGENLAREANARRAVEKHLDTVLGELVTHGGVPTSELLNRELASFRPKTPSAPPPTRTDTPLPLPPPPELAKP